jgi:flagellar basal body-associated protein FliL
MKNQSPGSTKKAHSSKSKIVTWILAAVFLVAVLIIVYSVFGSPSGRDAVNTPLVPERIEIESVPIPDNPVDAPAAE